MLQKRTYWLFCSTHSSLSLIEQGKHQWSDKQPELTTFLVAVFKREDRNSSYKISWMHIFGLYSIIFSSNKIPLKKNKKKKTDNSRGKRGFLHKEDTNEDVKGDLLMRAEAGVKKNHVISAAELIRHFLPLPAAPSCSNSHLKNTEDLLLLWTCVCREPPTVLRKCDRKTRGKLRSQFSGFYPQVMFENGYERQAMDVWSAQSILNKICFIFKIVVLRTNQFWL